MSNLGHFARYDDLSQKKTRWQGPKAEDVAREMELGFLYRHEYDYASTHVHPMASDGGADFVAVTTSRHRVPLPDSTVVRNSVPILRTGAHAYI
jgi:hypothetical protein